MSARKAHTPLSQKGGISLGQGFNEVVGEGRLGSSDHLIGRCTGAPIPDIVESRSRKDHGVLGHGANVAAQLLQCQLPDVDAVESNAALQRAIGTLVYVVEALEQLKNGGFSCTAGSDQRYRFSWL
ncbi:MAG: hypothetical protein ACD_23C00581G0001 [uncultured bacterium]|nr:MAG: hypothetical protein ACD_23C00581G0001 [uncultured bacterium]